VLLINGRDFESSVPSGYIEVRMAATQVPAGQVVRYTTNDAEPTDASTIAPQGPNWLRIPATDGVSYADAFGTHYRFTFRARSFKAGWVTSESTRRVFSVEADGSFYANS
jgi:hypothetical protein